ncbi:unnamed protein product, partial [Acanthocheilonema viteae]
TGNIFGSTFASSANLPPTTTGGEFTFGTKPAGSSSSLFSTPTTTTSLATAVTTTASANTTASIFSSPLGLGAKPSSLFASLTSPMTTITSVSTTNTQSSNGGLLFGTTSATTAANTSLGFGSSVTTTTVATTSIAPFSFGTSTSSSQPSGSLFGSTALQPTATVSATSAVGTSPTSLFGQKSASCGLFGQVITAASSTVPTTGFLFGSPTTAKSTFGLPAVVNTASTATAITTTAAPVLSFGFNTTTAVSGNTAPSLFNSTTSSLTTATTAPAVVFGSATSVAAPPFAGLFGTKTTSSMTSATTATSMSGLNVPGSAATTTSAAITAFSFGSSVLSPTSSILPSTQPVASITSAASTMPLFGVASQTAAAITTAASNGFAFGQLTATTASTVVTAATNTASLPIMTSFSQSATTTPGMFTASTVTSSGSTLSSLLHPSKTTAVTLPAIASILTATTTASTIASSALASAVPAATAITSDKPITFAQLEQLINRLTLDVETQQRVFMSQVLELNAFDRVLRENQQKVLDVSEEIKQLEEEKDRFLHAVDFISQQQTELEALVVDLEKALGLSDWTEMTPIGLPDPGVATHADLQRQAMLQLQLQIDAQLKQADDDISDIIEQVKELQRTSVGIDDQAETADQIAQILRRQLDALQWIDEQSYLDSRRCTSDLALCLFVFLENFIGFQEPNCEEFQRAFPNISIFSWIHFEGRNFENLLIIIKHVLLSRQNKRPTISLECEKVRDFETLENAIPIVDVVFVSKDFARKKGFQNKEEAVFGIQQKYGASRAIVICPWAEQGRANECFTNYWQKSSQTRTAWIRCKLKKQMMNKCEILVWT